MLCTYDPKQLDEFMRRERHGHTKLIAFNNLILQISPQYPECVFMVYLINVITLDLKLLTFI